MESLNADKIRAQVEFDRLMVAARAQKMRGDLLEAEKALLKALAIRFDDLNARELAADILFERGDFEKAAKHYKSLYSTERPRPSAEAGYARCVLKIAEIAQKREELLNPMNAQTAAFVPERRTPVVAAILSMIPGLGHVYCGQFTKAILIFSSWLFFLILIYIFYPWSLNAPANVKLSAGQPYVKFAFIALFIHAYAFVDAIMAAEKTRRKPAGTPLAWTPVFPAHISTTDAGGRTTTWTSGAPAPSSFVPSGPVPDDVATGLNWGAFVLAPFWSAAHNVWIGLLSVVPGAGLPMAFILLFKGNEWGWQSRRFHSISHFRAVQAAWFTWGVIVGVLWLVSMIIWGLVILLSPAV